MNCATYYLCEEILIEILKRLPVKSLLRFMAVCRLWKSIITSPQLNRLQCPSRLLVHTDRQFHALDEILVVVCETTDFPFKGKKLLRVIGSDNGLVCIRFYEEDFLLRRIILWNPSIRKHAVLPTNPFEDDPLGVLADGFGATISGIDYKYVRINVGFYVGQDDEYVLIYSWKTGAWRKTKPDFGLHRNKFLLSKKGVSLRGRLHWTVCDKFHSINSISCFDLEDEVFVQDILLPECFSSSLSLFLIKESLAVMGYEKEPPNCSVWVMQVYGDVNSWTFLCHVDATATTTDVDWALLGLGADRAAAYTLRMLVKNSMVHLLKNGELLLGLETVFKQQGMSQSFPPKLVKYNPKTRTRTHIRGVLSDDASSSNQLRGLINSYKESLVFVNHDHRVNHDHPVHADNELHFLNSNSRRIGLDFWCFWNFFLTNSSRVVSLLVALVGVILLFNFM